jgi:hypothetical protein
MCFRNSLTATVEEMEKKFEVQKQAKTSSKADTY